MQETDKIAWSVDQFLDEYNVVLVTTGALRPFVQEFLTRHKIGEGELSSLLKEYCEDRGERFHDSETPLSLANLVNIANKVKYGTIQIRL